MIPDISAVRAAAMKPENETFIAQPYISRQLMIRLRARARARDSSRTIRISLTERVTSVTNFNVRRLAQIEIINYFEGGTAGGGGEGVGVMKHQGKDAKAEGRSFLELFDGGYFVLRTSHDGVGCTFLINRGSREARISGRIKNRNRISLTSSVIFGGRGEAEAGSRKH